MNHARELADMKRLGNVMLPFKANEKLNVMKRLQESCYYTPVLAAE